ncbi:hypothetical protein ASF43_05630 [Pseudorhodoferax sp. Leaf267]|nr:hypothetical protein ASF43_05630 [Pseudorhodoferax sp. Leaf267]
MGVPLSTMKENPMSAVPMLQSQRRVPYLLGGVALPQTTSRPRRAVPALFLPEVRADRPLAVAVALP